MLGLLALAFLIVPILELTIFARLADGYGVGPTLLFIVVDSLVGAFLVRREGIGAFRRANKKLAQGDIPTDELINGLLILMAGALMLTPGFLTDFVGLLLLLPPTRAIARSGLKKRFATSTVAFGSTSGFGGFAKFGGFGQDDRESDDIWDVEGWEDPPDRPSLP